MRGIGGHWRHGNQRKPWVNAAVDTAMTTSRTPVLQTCVHGNTFPGSGWGKWQSVPLFSMGKVSTTASPCLLFTAWDYSYRWPHPRLAKPASSFCSIQENGFLDCKISKLGFLPAAGTSPSETGPTGSQLFCMCVCYFFFPHGPC